MPFESLASAASWYEAWLREAALPLWATAGRDAALGGFHEALAQDGRPVAGPVRARVQARQIFVYASAARAGIPGPWREIALQAFDYFRDRYTLPDGRVARLVDVDAGVLDDTPALYEQDFALLGAAALHRIAPGRRDVTEAAERIRDAIAETLHPCGGYREYGSPAFQQNPHMHLLEAALAWEDAGRRDWAPWSDAMAELALERLIDPCGYVREYFDDQWRPAAEPCGRRIEPGHQFEWAWLLKRWGERRNDPRGEAAARRLFPAGLRGVSEGLAVNALQDDFTVLDPAARLWPQTEYLKAALILGEDDHALTAARGLARYLRTPVRGLWRDRLLPGGDFIEEGAPATSFYHIWMACQALREAGRAREGDAPVADGATTYGRQERSPVLSLVVCTLNESESIAGVLREAGSALAGVSHEIIVVDDSPDERTAEVVRAYAAGVPNIRLLRRDGARGLSSAVIAGWDAARGSLLAVCDGDGQHDLQLLPRMMALMSGGETDLVAASRYIEDDTGLSGARDTMSRLATRVTTSLLIRGLTDPLSGFFMLRREVFEAARPRLSGVGFKILVDLVGSAPRRLRMAEVPAALRGRQHGESKLDIRVIADLGALLVEKRTRGVLPARFVLFAAVGASGVLVHLAALKALLSAGAPFALGQAGAILTAMTWNFWINNILTFRDMRLRGTAVWRGLATFYAACLGGGIFSEGLAMALHHFGVNAMAAGAIGALAAGLWNYYASRRATWSAGKPASVDEAKPVRRAARATPNE